MAKVREKKLEIANKYKEILKGIYVLGNKVIYQKLLKEICLEFNLVRNEKEFRKVVKELEMNGLIRIQIEEGGAVTIEERRQKKMKEEQKEKVIEKIEVVEELSETEKRLLELEQKLLKLEQKTVKKEPVQRKLEGKAIVLRRSAVAFIEGKEKSKEVGSVLRSVVRNRLKITTLRIKYALLKKETEDFEEFLIVFAENFAINQNDFAKMDKFFSIKFKVIKNFIEVGREPFKVEQQRLRANHKAIKENLKTKKKSAILKSEEWGISHQFSNNFYITDVRIKKANWFIEVDIDAVLFVGTTKFHASNIGDTIAKIYDFYSKKLFKGNSREFQQGESEEWPSKVRLNVELVGAEKHQRDIKIAFEKINKSSKQSAIYDAVARSTKRIDSNEISQRNKRNQTVKVISRSELERIIIKNVILY